MILAGDIGGTKTELALFEAGGPGSAKLREGDCTSYASREHSSFGEVLRAFLADHPGLRVEAACLGVAGPVLDGRSATTNLPWVLDERELGPLLGTTRVKLLNDLEATAFGMLFLGPDEVQVLAEGVGPWPRPGNVAVIAAGTGLGEAMLYWDGERYHPVASEGGHGDYAPTGELECELWRYLRGIYGGGHVSYERVLSGAGIESLYEFVRSRGKEPEPPWLRERIEGAPDPAAAISRTALAGESRLAMAALDLFVSIYGAEAGNLALRTLASGGVFVGGGIAPKILPALLAGRFLEAFEAKGRLGGFLKTLRVAVSLNPRTALWGAAHYARERR